MTRAWSAATTMTGDIDKTWEGQAREPCDLLFLSIADGLICSRPIFVARGNPPIDCLVAGGAGGQTPAARSCVTAGYRPQKMLATPRHVQSASRWCRHKPGARPHLG